MTFLPLHLKVTRTISSVVNVPTSSTGTGRSSPRSLASPEGTKVEQHRPFDQRNVISLSFLFMGLFTGQHSGLNMKTNNERDRKQLFPISSTLPVTRRSPPQTRAEPAPKLRVNKSAGPLFVQDCWHGNNYVSLTH